MATYSAVAAPADTLGAGSDLGTAHTAVGVSDSVQTASRPAQPHGALGVTDTAGTVARPPQPHVATTTTDTPGTAVRPPQPHTLVERDPDVLRTGVLVPGAFTAVPGLAVDANGEPLERSGYIVTKSNFAVAGEVDEAGRFTLSLLQATYTDFVFITDETDEYGLVWYEAEPVEVSPRDTQVSIPFTPAEPEQGGGGGLFVGGGINFG